MMNIKISAAILSALMLAASCGNNSEPQEKPAKGDYPVLKQTTLGVYDYKGKTWKYEEGEDQISRYYKDGKVDFSILNPDKGAIVTVSGIPEDVPLNQQEHRSQYKRQRHQCPDRNVRDSPEDQGRHGLAWGERRDWNDSKAMTMRKILVALGLLLSLQASP